MNLKYLIKTWNYNTRRSNKSLLNSAYLRSIERGSLKTKNRNFSLPDHQLAENLILVFGFYERTSKG